MISKSKYDRAFYEWTGDADFTRKTGIYPAIVGSDYREDPASEDSPLYAEILDAGPLWDCLFAGTTPIASERLKGFLKERLPEDLDFLPITLRNKDGEQIAADYYRLDFRHSLPVISEDFKLDRDRMVESSHRAMIGYQEGMPTWNTTFIAADIAEDMISSGFTGLGFRNAFGSKKPGWQGKNPRPFPEEAAMAEYLRSNPPLLIERIAVESGSIEEGWKSLLAEAAQMQPSPVWTKIESLDVRRDLEHQTAWLGDLLRHEPPPKSIRAYWFGLFDRAVGDELEAIATLYASGSDTYDEEERFDFDWAVDPKWFPAGRYAESDVLAAISREANCLHDPGSAQLKEMLWYFMVLGYAGLLVRHAAAALPEDALANCGTRKRPIAVGFDGGDATFVGCLSKSGWKK